LQYPSVLCTRIRCPSLISLVAVSTPTTAGKPYSRAMTAPWVISPPTSVTRPLMDTNNGVQLGSVKEVTKISPSSRTASSKDRRQAEGLVQLHHEMEVGYSRLVTISTDNMLLTNEYRTGVGAHWTFLSDPGRKVQKDLDIAEYTDLDL